MMTDVGNVSIALLVDRRLIRTASLQIVHADQAHVVGFGGIADFGRLRRGRHRQRKHKGWRTHISADVEDLHRSPPILFAAMRSGLSRHAAISMLLTRAR